MKQQEIVALTSLRGIAAIAVIAMHFSATMQTLAVRPFPSLAPNGELAVDVFFVLSGFIMAYTYLPSFCRGNSRSAYKDFLIKRTARILPLNIVTSAIIVLGALSSSWLLGTNLFPHAQPDNAATEFFANALMLPGLGIGESINWPAWSISVEFAAYFLFPIFLYSVFNPNGLMAFTTCAVAALGITVVCLTGYHLSPDGSHNHPFPWRDVVRCISEFTLGIGTYRAYQSGKLNPFFRNDLVSISLLIAIVTLVVLRSRELFILPFFPPLVLALALNNGRVAFWLSKPIPHFLGLISFSLYLVHESFRPISALVVRHYHPAPLMPLVAMTLAALFTVSMILPAWFCYSWIEHPTRKILRQLAGKKINKFPPRSTESPPMAQ